MCKSQLHQNPTRGAKADCPSRGEILKTAKRLNLVGDAYRKEISKQNETVSRLIEKTDKADYTVTKTSAFMAAQWKG